jgi:cytochrome P450
MSGSTCQNEHSLLRRHPPEATLIRAAINPDFNEDHIEPWRPMIREKAEGRAKALMNSVGTINLDLVTDFVLPLIADAVTVTTGLNEDQWKLLRSLTSRANAPIFSPRDHESVGVGQKALQYEFCMPVVTTMRAEQRQLAAHTDEQPAPPVLPATIASLDQLGMPEQEVVGTILPIFAGFPTTIPILIALVYEAMLLPDVLNQLAHNPDDLSILSAAVWEHLRRNVHFPHVLPGVTSIPIRTETGIVPSGAIVIPMTGIAEHDTSVERSGRQNPGKYDLNRPRRKILAFGKGVHVCPGQAWVLLVASEALRAVSLIASEMQLRLAVAPKKIPRLDTLADVPALMDAPARIPVAPAAILGSQRELSRDLA